MAWGLGVGILMIAMMFAFFGIVIFKETRTHRFWQRKVEEGDLDMITQLVQEEVSHWRTERPPKGMPASVWQGIQGVEVIEIQPDEIHVSTTAEPQFALVSGSRRQVTSALDEAKRVIAKLAERLFYDIPHVRPARVQIDCYTTFQEPNGQVTQRCILSALADRAEAAEVDWDNDAPEVIAERLGALYELDSRGVALPIDPARHAAWTTPNGVNGSPRPPETL
jgi:hypothetical protein